ncbi:hypothetical protein GCM10008983_01950 [Lentibacillus halophilus]|uniref:Uncharacterized protein n=1 Tax=Lentibacillus halophilus TaxID=295065 RepID=A0ABP3IVT0_9BACI
MKMDKGNKPQYRNLRRRKSGMTANETLFQSAKFCKGSGHPMNKSVKHHARQRYAYN